MSVLIKLTETRPPDVSIRNWRKITKAAHEAEGRHFVERFLPGHFRSGAASKYGYRPRKPRTVQRKQALAKLGKVEGRGQIPLLWSGLFRSAMLGHRLLRGYPTRVRIDFNAPRYAPARQRTSKQPHLSDEALRVTPGERQELGDLLGRRVFAGLAAVKTKRVTVI